MTPNELAFYKILRSAIPDSYMICPKVRIADLLHYSGRSSRYGGLLRIANKHVDFAIIRESDSTLVMAIELDSHHHQWQKKTMNRDLLVNEAFSTAGLPLARFNDTIEHSVSVVRAKLRDCYQPVAA